MLTAIGILANKIAKFGPSSSPVITIEVDPKISGHLLHELSKECDEMNRTMDLPSFMLGLGKVLKYKGISIRVIEKPIDR